ncbi:MAG: hypothetical protein MK160_08485 [Rhodobacteraceae bacterium]|nr:hypothetical protein [Paracoccaceae bacterium]
MSIVPVTDIFLLAAQEIRIQLRQLGALESAVGTLTLSAPNIASSEQVTILQEFDHLSQSLTGLVAYLDHATTSTSDTVMVDTGPVLQDLPLRDMADRLAGELRQGTHQRSTIELF